MVLGSLLLAIATAAAPPSLGRGTSWDQPHHVPALVFSASFLAVAKLKFPRCLLICGCGRRVTMAINSKRFTPGSVCPFTAGRAPGVEAQTRSAFASSRRLSEQLECTIFRSGASPLVSLSNAGADTQSFASVSWSISVCGSAKMSEDLSAVRSSRFRFYLMLRAPAGIDPT